MMDEHTIPLEDLLKRLDSTYGGLAQAEAALRLKDHGPNELKVHKETPEIIKFLRQFTNFFAILLMVGSALAFFAEYLQPGGGNFHIGVALIVVVLLNALFTYIQERESERIMESFRNMLPPKITVLRDSRPRLMEARLLVPGDVMFLEEGDRIPADGRLIEVNQLKVDNSALTGESEPQLRKLECTHQNILESRNMVFSGTLVQSGNGKALVYGAGMGTQIGRIVRLTKEIAQVETPIRKELKRFIRIISAIAIILGILFFGISVILGEPFIGSLIFAIGIIVANVPEGLLPTVTLALTMASRRMAAKNALIKNLEAVETLGSTTVICTDKTGTITQNRISVNTLVIHGREWSAFQGGLAKAEGLDDALRTMVFCNNARLTKKGWQGDPTEAALVQAALAQPHPGPVPYQQLQPVAPRIAKDMQGSRSRARFSPVAPRIAKDKSRTRARRFAQHLLHSQRQAVHAAAHIDRRHHQPNRVRRRDQPRHRINSANQSTDTAAGNSSRAPLASRNTNDASAVASRFTSTGITAGADSATEGVCHRTQRENVVKFNPCRRQ